jgi:hypothetical protein
MFSIDSSNTGVLSFKPSLTVPVIGLGLHTG